MNKILSIKEIENFKLDERYYGEYDGYEIKTDKDNIKILIDNGQYCCENAGYFAVNDDLDYFIGADLLSTSTTDLELEEKILDEKDICLDCGGVQFVTFGTDKGKFQLAVYNEHNGYYGHDIKIIINEEVILEDCL